MLMRLRGRNLIATASRADGQPWLTQILRLLGGRSILRASKAELSVDAALRDLDRVAAADGAEIDDVRVAVTTDQRDRGRATAVLTAKLAPGRRQPREGP